MPDHLIIDVPTGARTIEDRPADPSRFLDADRATIPADGTTPVVVSYRDSFADAPSSVTFDVNGATVSEALVDGAAEIEVTASTPGPIVVTAGGFTIEFAAEEV